MTVATQAEAPPVFEACDGCRLPGSCARDNWCWRRGHDDPVKEGDRAAKLNQALADAGAGAEPIVRQKAALTEPPLEVFAAGSPCCGKCSEPDACRRADVCARTGTSLSGPAEEVTGATGAAPVPHADPLNDDLTVGDPEIDAVIEELSGDPEIQAAIAAGIDEALEGSGPEPVLEHPGRNSGGEGASSAASPGPEQKRRGGRKAIWDRPKCRAAFRAFHARTGRTPTQRDAVAEGKEGRERTLPSDTVIRRLYPDGGWAEAARDAGLEPAKPRNGREKTAPTQARKSSSTPKAPAAAVDPPPQREDEPEPPAAVPAALLPLDDEARAVCARMLDATIAFCAYLRKRLDA